MARSPRQIVRSAVGLAAVAPAIGLIVLGIALAASGGFSGVLAGIVVAGIAVLLLGAGLMMTHAPVTIHNLLQRTEEKRAAREHPGTSSDGGSNGHERSGRLELDSEDASDPREPAER